MTGGLICTSLGLQAFPIPGQGSSLALLGHSHTAPHTQLPEHQGVWDNEQI